jgi:hypothetical protein
MDGRGPAIGQHNRSLRDLEGLEMSLGVRDGRRSTLNLGGSRRDEILGREMVNRLGLSQEIVNEIEGHLDLALARAKEEMDVLHSKELQGVKHEVHAKVGDTMEAMHVHWEARDSRNTDFWGKEIMDLRKELDRVGQDYHEQRTAHQSLAEKGAKRAQETSVMRKELEACRQELKVVKEREVAQEWLMYEYPGGMMSVTSP